MKNHSRPILRATLHASINIIIIGGVSCMTEQELFANPDQNWLAATNAGASMTNGLQTRSLYADILWIFRILLLRTKANSCQDVCYYQTSSAQGFLSDICRRLQKSSLLLWTAIALQILVHRTCTSLKVNLWVYTYIKKTLFLILQWSAYISESTVYQHLVHFYLKGSMHRAIHYGVYNQWVHA